jgi:hypothetical protein
VLSVSAERRLGTLGNGLVRLPGCTQIDWFCARGADLAASLENVGEGEPSFALRHNPDRGRRYVRRFRLSCIAGPLGALFIVRARRS